MKNMRERALAAAVAMTMLFVTDRSVADPSQLGDPADPSNLGATGTFGEGTNSIAQPDPVSGIMRYAFPFELPAARGPAQPRLALTYSSSSRDREAGYGWGLDIPAIERRPLSGNPRFEAPSTHRGTSDERFFFDGQPLVRICTVPACPSGEEHPAWASGWRYFRLQVEGLFARFYLSADLRQWRVQLKGGQRMDFGGSSETVEFIGDETRIVRWRLVRQLDALHLNGGEPLNYVRYRWQKLGTRGLAYLTDIFDTPRATGHASDLDFAHHTQLAWDDPGYPQTAYADALHATPDLRLARVGVSSKTWTAATAREVTRIYKLGYLAPREPLVPYNPETIAPLWHHSFLQKIEVEGTCGAVEDGAGNIPATTGCRSLPATTFQYRPGHIGFSLGKLPEILGGPPDLVTNRRVVFDVESANVVDFDRDGMPDVVQSWESGPNCHGNPGSTVVGNSGNGVGDRIACFYREPWEILFGLIKGNATHQADVGSSRLMLGYINRGTDGSERVRLAHQCMDGGSDLGRTPARSPANLNAGKAAAFFTSQGGATVAGAWSTGVVTWVPDSVPNFAPRAFFAEPINGGFGGSGCDPVGFDPVSFHPRWRWMTIDARDWAKDGDPRPGNTGPNWFTDVDGDGLVDEIQESGQPASGEFRPGYVHFTRRFAANEASNASPVQKPFFFDSTTLGTSLVPAPGRTNTKYTYVDVNGDALVDLVVSNTSVNGGIPRVRLGDGRGNFSCDPSKQPWPCAPAGDDITPGYDIEFIGPPADTKKANFQFHDVTGDGLADMVHYEASSGAIQGSVSLWVNVDGRRFACAAPNSGCVVGRVLDDVHSTFDIGPHRMTFADMNADGVDDLVILARAGVFALPMVHRGAPTYGQGGPRPGLLTRIDNGLGATTQIEYKSIQQLDVEYDATPLKWRHHSRAVEAVVTKITTRDTASVNGSPLADPYRFERSVTYGYLDPAYDRWTRRFSGFRKVAAQVGGESAITMTTNWFGPCQNDHFYTMPGDKDDNSAHRCSETSDDEPAKAKTGRSIRVDRYIPGIPGEERSQGTGRPEKWLWSREFHWDSRTVTSAEERSVTFAYVSRIDTHIYDDALPVTPSESRPGRAGADAVEPPPTQPGSERELTQFFQYDDHGNLVHSEDRGKDQGPEAQRDHHTITVLRDLEPDTYLVPSLSPAPLRLTCSADWVCNPTYIATYGLSKSGDAPVVRKLRLTYELPGNGGGIAVTEAFMDKSPPQVQRQPPAALPSGASGFGWRVLATTTFDVWGNAIESVQGPMSASPQCQTVVYDSPYRQLLAGTRKHTDGCGSSSLDTFFVFDRGFGQLVAMMEPSMAVTWFELDPYGRTKRVYVPQRDGALGLTTLSAAISYHDEAPLPHIETSTFPSAGGDAIRSIIVLNGLGERVLQFDEGDSTAPWILQGFAIRDASGRPMIVRRPTSFTGDPLALAATASPPPMASDYVFHSFDGFGRLYLTTATASGLQHVRREFHPLVVDTRDANGALTRTELDGHGRVQRAVQHVGGEDIVTSVEFLPTGEPARVSRTSGPRKYERSLVYDGLGRLVRNHEPNTGDWRYAWDDAGRLVGTSDARGCGKNIHYDGLGRIIGEDYAPCLPFQPAYSPPVLATGEGFEVFNRFDVYEDGQMSSEPTFVENARLSAGKLVSYRDRGSYTRFNYDARGSIRRISRRVASPSGDDYVGAKAPGGWWAQRTDYDDLGRVIRRTAGTSITPRGPAEEFYSYSTRGLLNGIGSTYGPIVRSITYEPDGAAARIVYGDVASTQARVTYGMTSGTRRLERYEVTRDPPPGNLWSTHAPPDYPRPDWTTTQTELARFEYEYDAVGNPEYIHDHVSPAQYSNHSDKLPIGLRRAAFDELHRLKEIGYFYDAPSAEADFDHGPYLPELKAGDHRPVPPQIRLPTRVRYQAFTYDFMGNLTSSVDDLNAYYDRSLGNVTHGTATNGPNQIRAADGITATHDVAGNLTELKVTRVGDCISGSESRCAQWFAYDWDEVGQLVRARRWDYRKTSPWHVVKGRAFGAIRARA